MSIEVVDPKIFKCVRCGHIAKGDSLDVWQEDVRFGIKIFGAKCPRCGSGRMIPYVYRVVEEVKLRDESSET